MASETSAAATDEGTGGGTELSCSRDQLSTKSSHQILEMREQVIRMLRHRP